MALIPNCHAWFVKKSSKLVKEGKKGEGRGLKIRCICWSYLPVAHKPNPTILARRNIFFLLLNFATYFMASKDSCKQCVANQLHVLFIIFTRICWKKHHKFFQISNTFQLQAKYVHVCSTLQYLSRIPSGQKY